MAHSCTPHTEARQPDDAPNPRYVHSAVPDGVFPGQEVLLHLLTGVPGGCFPHMLFRAGLLHLLELGLRG